MRVMTHSLVPADRSTHVRIVGVALAGAMAFVTAFLAVGAREPGNAVVAGNAPIVVKAEKATTWTNRETTGAVR
jgi:hypothetical protein